MGAGAAAAVVATVVALGGAAAVGLTAPPPGAARPPEAAPVVLTVVDPAPPVPPGSRAEDRRPPVPGGRVRAFEAPAHDYAPGHRGVDLEARAGQQVRAPAPGVVTFAGPVAGRGVVVLQHAGGTLTSLEPVQAQLPVGSQVDAGQPVAVLQADPPHEGCVTARTPQCLHWGVRVEGRYVDPWWWLGLVGPVRLLPVSDP